MKNVVLTSKRFSVASLEVMAESAATLMSESKGQIVRLISVATGFLHVTINL